MSQSVSFTSHKHARKFKVYGDDATVARARASFTNLLFIYLRAKGRLLIYITFIT